MSNIAPTPSRGTDAAEGSHFTVEDTGSTTDASDLFHNDTTAGAETRSGAATDSERSATGRSDLPGASPADPTAPSAPEAPESPSAPSGLAALAGDDSIAHVFDQTNGVLDRLEGDSDGTADSDVLSGAERAQGNPAFDAFADSEATSTRNVDDARVTGD